MSQVKGIKPVLGTASFGDPNSVWGKSEDNVAKAFTILKKHGANNLDTAQVYTGSEQKLGEAKVSEHDFVIDTKWGGGYNQQAGGNSRENMLATAKTSLEKLGVTQVDVFYIHSPDYKSPLEDMLAGVNDAYKAGMFRRFGLSNYPPEDVQKVHDVCKKHGFVLPTVYQGNYSAVARKQEETLFPLLRTLGMSFYAYSPIAGGFLTKTKKQIEAGGTRFSKDVMYGIYHTLYVKDAYMDALEKWEQIADEEGVSKAELAYRWVAFNSPLKPEHGDALVIGASSLAQLDQTLGFFDKGPLSEKAALGIDGIWKMVAHEAGVDNYQVSTRNKS